MSDHAQLAPSASRRWLACPGSIALSADLPMQESGAAAEHGTREHERAAALLNGDDHATTSEDVALYVDTVKRHMQKRGAVSFIEQRVQLTEDIHGTADALVIHRNTLYVFDLKTGRTPVEVAGNTQLMIYAGAAMRTFVQLTRRVHTIKLIVVQPHAGGLSTATISWRRLESQIAGILAAAERTKEPQAAVVAGEHCTFCPAASVCPARKREALAMARHMFAETGPSDAAKVFAHEYGPRIVEWLEAIHEASIRIPPPGYRVVEGKGRRIWRADVDVPLTPKPMTLAEAQSHGFDLDTLTEHKSGKPKLIRDDRTTLIDAFTITRQLTKETR